MTDIAADSCFTPDAAVRRARWAVATVFFVNGAGFASWVSRIPALRSGLSLSDAALGSVLFAMSVGVLLSFPIAARGVRLLGARQLTLVAGLLTVALLPVPFMVGIVPSLVLVLLELGLANGMTDVAMNVLAVDVQSRMGRPVMSSLHGMWSAGGFVGAAAGGAAAHAGLAPAWHLGAVAAVLALLLVVAATQLGGAVSPRATPRPAPASASRTHGRARLDRILLGFGLLCFCTFLVEGALADWTAVYLRDRLHTTESLAALGYAVFAAAMMGMRLCGDRVLARFGAARVLPWLNAAGAVSLGLALAAGSVGPTLPALAIVGLGLATVVPSVFSAAARHAAARDEAGAGRAIAWMAGFGYTGFLVGPPVMGWFAQATDLRVAMGLLALLIAGIAVLAPTLRENAPPNAG
jgi:MFS family permease